MLAVREDWTGFTGFYKVGQTSKNRTNIMRTIEKNEMVNITWKRILRFRVIIRDFGKKSSKLWKVDGLIFRGEDPSDTYGESISVIKSFGICMAECLNIYIIWREVMKIVYLHSPLKRKEFAAGGQLLGSSDLVSQCFKKNLFLPLSVRCLYTLYVKGWY